MSRPVIRLSSVTYAIRAQKLLERQGIKSYVKKLSKSVAVNGCGYGLEINGDLDEARRIIESGDIRITEIVSR